LADAGNGRLASEPEVRATTFMLLVLAAIHVATGMAAAEPAIPLFWDTKERLVKPDLAPIPRVRFLTTIDFPPFNFIDANGRLTGFHVDLTRAICAELEIMEKCQIQALPWAELKPALAARDGEAIVAGLAVTEEARREYAFSRSYLQFPARFIMPKDKAVTEPVFSKLRGERIGVIAGSAHEKMLRAYFPDAKPVTYSKQEWLLGDLKTGKLAAVFSDGMRLGFWLAGSDSAGCCRYAGGPYLSPEFLGSGLAIAVEPENAVLATAFDYALQQISAKGIFAELYLRYFPVSFY